MRIATCQLIIAVALFVSTSRAQMTVVSDVPKYFTNQAFVANGSNVVAALCSGDMQRQARAHSLIGSQVAFVGFSASWTSNADLIVLNRYLDINGCDPFLKIEINPARDVRPHTNLCTAEVLGTLKSIDFKNRIIHIKAKPEDWKVRDIY